MAFKDYLTAEGERLLAKSVSKSLPITFTKLVMGSGYLAEGTSEKNINDVIVPVQEIPIKSVQLNGNTSTVISAYINNESLEAGFYFREKAIYMKAGTEEVLAIYGNAGSTAEYIDTADVCITEKIVRTVLQLSSNEIANLTITDGTSALAPIIRSGMTLDEFVQTDTALSVVAGQTIVLKGLVYHFLGGDQRDTANYTAGIKLSDEYETAIEGADEFGGIAATQNALNKVYSIVQEVKTAFQDGCDVIVAGCTTYGGTPDSNSPNDIVDSIREIYENRYDAGYDEGFSAGGSAAEPTLQAKSVTLGTTAQTIKPDEGYDGLSQVTVPAVTGTAGAGDVLAGKTFNSATAGIAKTGTLADKTGTAEYTVTPALDSTNSELEMSIPATGKYSTSNKLKATFATIASLIGLTAAKIVKGNTILGIAGNSNNMDTSGADATAAQVLSGKKVCVDGSLLTGTMTNRQGSTVDASAVSSDDTYTYFTTPAGSYSASSKVRAKNSNLASIVADGKYESYTFDKTGKYRVFAVANKDGWLQYGVTITFNSNGGNIITTRVDETVIYANTISKMYSFDCNAVVGSSITYSAPNADGSALYLFIEKIG